LKNDDLDGKKAEKTPVADKELQMKSCGVGEILPFAFDFLEGVVTPKICLWSYAGCVPALPLLQRPA
jgi:hypothetical protein